MFCAFCIWRNPLYSKVIKIFFYIPLIAFSISAFYPVCKSTHSLFLVRVRDGESNFIFFYMDKELSPYHLLDSSFFLRWLYCHLCQYWCFYVHIKVFEGSLFCSVCPCCLPMSVSQTLYSDSTMRNFHNLIGEVLPATFPKLTVLSLKSANYGPWAQRGC